MNISDKGIKLIKSFEKLCLTSYKCQAGKNTIGYGHVLYNNSKITITKEKAEELLRNDLIHFVNVVNTSIQVPLTQNEFDALVSLAFNIGGDNFKKSQVVTRNINNGRKDLAAQGFLVWNKVTVIDENTGKYIKIVSNGLVTRRKIEREVFLNGYEEML